MSWQAKVLRRLTAVPVLNLLPRSLSTSILLSHDSPWWTAAGLNVLLISRTEAKLAAASQEIASKFNVQTKYTVVDFSHADEATWRRTAAVMSTLNIGVLINNVALSYDHPEYLEQLSEQQIREMIEVNITSVNQVTSMLSPLAHL